MNEQVADKNSEIISQLLSGAAVERYQGRQVVVVGGRAHLLPEDRCEATGILAQLEQQYPNEIFHCVCVPHPL